MNSFQQRVQEVSEWFGSPRFKGIVRLYSPRQVVEQRGTIRPTTRSRARPPRISMRRLRELFEARKSITTFGPYSPGPGGRHQARPASKASTSAGGRRPPRAASRKTRAPILPAIRSARCPTKPRPSCARCSTADKNQHFYPRAHDRRAARGHAGSRLPPVHHRRRRHRSRRRRARAQPDPPLRRGRACPATTSKIRSPA